MLPLHQESNPGDVCDAYRYEVDENLLENITFEFNTVSFNFFLLSFLL